MPLAAVPARAQVPAGPEFTVNTYTTYSQANPSVGSDARGNFVVVWRTAGQDGSNYGIAARRFDASGAALGPDFVVNTYTTGFQFDPALAVAPDGSFVVAWASPHDSSDYGVFARRFDAGGAPVGAEFQVNTFITGAQRRPALAMDRRGNFVVVWKSNAQDGFGWGVFGQRFDRVGQARGAEFRVNTGTQGDEKEPVVASDPAGNFVVVWMAGSVVGQRFDSAGTPLGSEFQVSAPTTRLNSGPTVTTDAAGNFVVTWTQNFGCCVADLLARRFDRNGAPLGTQFVVANTLAPPAVASDDEGNFVVTYRSRTAPEQLGQRFDSSGAPRGGVFQVNTGVYNRSYWDAVSSDPSGNFVVTWSAPADGNAYGVQARRFGGLLPASLAADPTPGPVSDGNGVLEPAETAVIAPSWRNVNGASLSFDGAASALTGPTGPVYTLVDGTAAYGSVPNGAVSTCASAGNCYVANVTAPSGRPGTHWDAELQEHILPDALGQSKRWSLHIGDSFGDVPRASSFYRFVETILHHGITGGCTSAAYCPVTAIARDQMAVFVLVAKEGTGYAPPPCGAPMFGDVPATSPFCRWIEELARRGVVGGCGGGNYCPTAAVSREEMAVFVLATKEPGVVPPPCGAPMFGDVPASSPFCRWIEELARRGVVAGCGGGNYCPAAALDREQMSVFVAVTFGLLLYAP